MAKFYGAIGYADTVKTAPGVWTDIITERNYSGEVIKNSKRNQAGENLNDDLTISNKISIIADPYAYSNCHVMKYIQWMGTKWKIITVDVERPRLILSIGGVYNGKTSTTSTTS